MRWKNKFLKGIRYEAPDSGTGYAGEGSGVSEAPSQPATSSAPEASSNSISDDILSLFKQEFGGEQAADETTQASSAPVEPQAPVVEEAPSQEQSQEQEVPAQAQAPTQDLHKALADSLATIKALQEQLATRNQEQDQTKAQAPAQDPVFDSDPAAFYNYQIPQALYNALFSSESTPEERVNALQGFAKAISVNTHRQLMNSLGAWTKENFNAVPKVVEYMLKQNQQISTTRASIKESFYKEFPDLQRPELGPLLKATIQQVQAETKAQAWSAAMQKQVGTRMRALLASFAPKATPAPAPTPVPTAVKPAPQIQSTDPNGAEAIAATLASIF
jgi:hypothetical protein